MSRFYSLYRGQVAQDDQTLSGRDPDTRQLRIGAGHDRGGWGRVSKRELVSVSAWDKLPTCCHIQIVRPVCHGTLLWKSIRL